ncbi:MAG TPA: MalY/PatB family protein [Bacillota bacterium]|nr:MalY/PatB family protein [Bacillota bacterium]
MTHSFDQIVERRNTDSMKWDKLKQLFGSAEVLPMWVADMDFLSPPAVVKAITERAKHGVYGYTIMSDSFYEAIIGWMERRHQWQVNKEWLCYCPGIVTALSILVEVLTKPGESVMIQPPVYTPFFQVISRNGRSVKEVPLILEEGQYRMDFELLEEAMKTSKVMILCSPHNPVGRVWSRDELVKLGELSSKYQVIIISDEIHADLVFNGEKHLPFGMLSEEIAQQSITCIAPSKTFNIAGLKTASIIIPNPKIRRLFENRIQTLSLHLESCFGVDAVKAAYNEGEVWVDELMNYMQGNLQYLAKFLQEHLPMVKLIQSQGTYLAWLDFRDLQMEADELQTFLTQKAKVGLSAGTIYGSQGAGFMRMNLGCPRSVVEEGLRRIHKAITELQK